jgi:hypothetical protein
MLVMARFQFHTFDALMREQADDAVLDRVKVREAAGVFRSRAALEAAVDALLRACFDRADNDFMASADAVREKLGAVYVAAEELADVPRAPGFSGPQRRRRAADS